MDSYPYSDFKLSLLDNDLRFVGVRGYHISCPGMDDKKLIKKYGFKIIEGTTCGNISYEMGKSNLIARYYAKKYNSYLEDFINKMKALKLARSLSGYSVVSGRFIIANAISGNLNLLPPSLCIDILDKKKCIISAARWFNPMTNGVPEYTWMDFLEVYQNIQYAAADHKWLKDWCDNSTNRWISAAIFGKRPYTETNFDYYPRSAWHHANLPGEPYYELRFIENGKPLGTLFLGKQSHDAIITDMSKNESKYWLDNLEFLYYPKDDIPSYAIVHSNGSWYTNKNKKTQLSNYKVDQ